MTRTEECTEENWDCGRAPMDQWNLTSHCHESDRICSMILTTTWRLLEMPFKMAYPLTGLRVILGNLGHHVSKEDLQWSKQIHEKLRFKR